MDKGVSSRGGGMADTRALRALVRKGRESSTLSRGTGCEPS